MSGALSKEGTDVLVALCRYVYQHGNVCREAIWAAELLASVGGSDVRKPFHQNKRSVEGLKRALRDLRKVTGLKV